MRRMLSVLLMGVLLTGCGTGQQVPDRIMLLRQRLQTQVCSFDGAITADYGTAVYDFTLHCQGMPDGSLHFTVTEPESIRDITGIVCQAGGRLTFDGTLLAFPMLADGQLTPVSAPWLLFNTLRSGCLTSWGREGEDLLLSMDDSYQSDPLHLDIRLDPEDRPVLCQILWRDRRIVTVQIRNFRFTGEARPGAV